MENQFGSRCTWSRHWLVIYTRPRWEKKVDKLLKLQDIKSYCPIRSVTSQWADRKKIVDLPLFSGYVFVWVNEREEYKVRQTLGVLNFVYYMGKPAVIRDKVIENIEELMSKNHEYEIIDAQEITLGDRVRIKHGIFYNQEGTVIKVRGKHVLMLLDHLNCAIVSSIAIADVILNTAI
ncbi:UpxY family transcription antiterminator [Pedobacter gandavensis]|uniref:UpxY family transcription antiterminator n=1 Tax=Pedobacter gandavensis TaxID=2679963 RepID=UPI00292FD68B|nr:UpxY family transcription antiterminator [Pedobacter gandavensis]